MSPPKTLLAGSFTGSGRSHGEITQNLSVINIQVTTDVDEMEALLAAPDEVRKYESGKPSKKWGIAEEKGLAIVSESWLDAMMAKQGFVEAEPYFIVQPTSGSLSTTAQAAAEQAAADAAEQAVAAQAAADQAAADQAAAEQAAAQEKAAQEKAAQEKAAQEKAAQEKAAQEKAAQEKAATERAADNSSDGVGVGTQAARVHDDSMTSEATGTHTVAQNRDVPLQSVETHDVTEHHAPSIEHHAPSPEHQAPSSLLTSDLFQGRSLPPDVLIEIPPEKRPEGEKAEGVIECMIGSYLLVTEMIESGARRAYLLPGSRYPTQKSKFMKINRLVLQTEEPEEWRKYILGEHVHIELVAQSPAMSVAICFKPNSRSPYKFTATGLRKVWKTAGQEAMKNVMERADQGPFLSRSEMHDAPKANPSAQNEYLTMRAQTISRESVERQQQPTPPPDDTNLPREKTPASMGKAPSETEVKRAVDTLRKLSPEQVNRLFGG